MSVTDEQPGPAEDGWGTRPTERRQAELEKKLHEWDVEDDHGDRRGPFDGIWLNGAEIFWLAIQAAPHDISKAEAEQLLRNPSTPSPIGLFDLSRLHLEGAILGGAHLKGAYLGGAHLEKANLPWAHLEGAYLGGAYLEGADLREAYLEGANLREAGLRRAILVGANLHKADITRAGLQRANLYKADLREGEFDEADLRGSSLVAADLRGANLSRAIFDIEANLADAKMGDREHGFASVIDTAWNGVILASVDWSGLFRRHWWRPLSGGKLGDDRRGARLAARAHRQLALTLRAQGLSVEAAELDYRARIRANQDLWHKRRRLAALFSWLGCVVSGYGYRLGRCFAFYVGVVVLFSVIYWRIPYGYGLHSSPLRLSWWPQAVILSFTSFHGRGFLPSEVTGSVVQGAWAAGEAVVGLLIEATLIATFTQRVFR